MSPSGRPEGESQGAQHEAGQASKPVPTAVDEVGIDAQLLAALRSAPDRDLAPPRYLDAAILSAARQAAQRRGVGVAQRSAAATTWHGFQPFRVQSFLEWLGLARALPSGGFAVAAVMLLAVSVWWGREPPPVSLDVAVPVVAVHQSRPASGVTSTELKASTSETAAVPPVAVAAAAGPHSARRGARNMAPAAPDTEADAAQRPPADQTLAQGVPGPTPGTVRMPLPQVPLALPQLASRQPAQRPLEPPARRPAASASPVPDSTEGAFAGAGLAKSVATDQRARQEVAALRDSAPAVLPQTRAEPSQGGESVAARARAVDRFAAERRDAATPVAPATPGAPAALTAPSSAAALSRHSSAAALTSPSSAAALTTRDTTAAATSSRPASTEPAATATAAVAAFADSRPSLLAVLQAQAGLADGGGWQVLRHGAPTGALDAALEPALNRLHLAAAGHWRPMTGATKTPGSVAANLAAPGLQWLHPDGRSVTLRFEPTGVHWTEEPGARHWWLALDADSLGALRRDFGI